MADSGGLEWGRVAQPGPIETLEYQMKAFEAAVGPQDWTRFGETAGFTEWLAGMSRVSPETRTLGVIWHAALLSLIEGGPSRFEILQVAAAMTEADSVAFLGWLRWLWLGGAVRRAQPTRLRARRLHELGLLRAVFGLSRLTPLGARLERLIGEIRAGRCGQI